MDLETTMVLGVTWDNSRSDRDSIESLWVNGTITKLNIRQTLDPSKFFLRFLPIDSVFDFETAFYVAAR